MKKNVSSSKRVPIQSTTESQNHVEDVAEVAYQRRGGHNLMKKVDSYKVELCVVLIEEKEPNVISTIVTECSDVQNIRVTTPTSNGTSRKRKTAPFPFIFPASVICISIFSPIEAHQNKNKVTSSVPSGNTYTDITYDLTPFILIGTDGDSSEYLDDGAEDVYEIFATRLLF